MPPCQEVTQSHTKDLWDLLHGMHPGISCPSQASRMAYCTWLAPYLRFFYPSCEKIKICPCTLGQLHMHESTLDHMHMYFRYSNFKYYYNYYLAQVWVYMQSVKFSQIKSCVPEIYKRHQNWASDFLVILHKLFNLFNILLQRKLKKAPSPLHGHPIQIVKTFHFSSWMTKTSTWVENRSFWEWPIA